MVPAATAAIGTGTASSLGGAGAAAGEAANAFGKLSTNIGMANDALGIMGDTVNKVRAALKALTGKWIEFQDIAFKSARTMAMSREMAMRYDRQLMQSTKDLARQYGITAKEIADFQKEYSEAVGRNVILTKKQIESMAALSKITDSATASQLVDEFDKIGVGIEGATAKIGLMQERAKALGINATKATKTFKDNIKLAASYSFKNGVADIEKMAMKATSVRMDMNAVMSAADKFQNIESAIQTSAKLQVLGGSFGSQFGNPMTAMYQAKADPKKFMDNLVKMVEGKGSYNSKTGEVKFDPVTMDLMKAAADALGVTVDKLTNPAMANIQNKKVEEELRKAGTWDKWTEAQQTAIQNLSRTNVGEDGKHYITWMDKNGKEQKEAIENLTEEQLKIAQDRQMSEEGLFSDVQDIKDILERTLGRARETTSTKENLTGLSEEWDAFISQFQNMYMPTVSNMFNGQSFGIWDLGKMLSNFWGRNSFGFAEGGIVNSIPHASLGTIVKGSSRMGDKTPILANAGEMVLNEREQKGLFDILKSVATTGAMVYGGNKIGKQFGLKGLGLDMGIGSLLNGGNMSIGGMLGVGAGSFMRNRMPMPMAGMGNALTLVNPNVIMNGQIMMNGGMAGGMLTEGMEDMANAASEAGKTTRSFSKRLRDLSKRNTFLGKGAKWLRNRQAQGIKLGRLASNKFNSLGWVQKSKAYKDFLGKSYYDSSVGRYRTSGKFVGKGDIGNWATKGILRGKGFFKNIGKDLSILGGEGASKATKAAGKGSKALGALSKGGKLLGRASGVLTGVFAAIEGIGAISSASNQYDSTIKDIEKSNMSVRDKARAKDEAAKQKNKSIGGGVGTAIGGAIGGIAGMALGPLGSIVGGWLGSTVGGFLGKGIGSLFGGNEEKKLEEKHKKRREKYLSNKKSDFSFGKVAMSAGKVALSTLMPAFGAFLLGKKLGLGKAFKGLFSGVGKVASNIVKGAGNIISGAGKFVSKAAKGVGKFISGAFNSTKKFFGGIVSGIGGFISGTFKKAKKLFGNVVDGIGSVASKIKKKSKAIMSAGKNIASKAVNKVGNFATTAAKFGGKFIKSGGLSMIPGLGAIGALMGMGGLLFDKENKGNDNPNIILKSIDKKLSLIVGKDVKINGKQLDSPEINPLPISGNFEKIKPSSTNDVSFKTNKVDLSDINLNVSGTIKLEGGSNSTNLDIDKLLEEPGFKRQLAEIITKRLNDTSNAGKSRNETLRNNTANIYSRTNYA